MRKIELYARAKINLSLDVLNKRDDGYHNIISVMQSIDLCDTIIIKKIKSGIELYSDSHEIPLNSDNIVFKAVQLIKDTFNIDYGVEVTIIKRIPVAAGLGGGSSDAATVLKGLNQLWDMNLCTEELKQLGLMLGADVPYCIEGGTALAQGIGEIITPIQPRKNYYMVLIKPPIQVSTAQVYKEFDLDKTDRTMYNTEQVIQSINKGDLSLLGKTMFNVLEQVTLNMHPEIEEIKKNLLSEGALGSIMSGSGPSVFGVFSNKDKAIKAYDNLKYIYNSIFVVNTCK